MNQRWTDPLDTATMPRALAPCAYCGCERALHPDDRKCSARAHPDRKPGERLCYGYVPEPADLGTSEYQQGFVDGYLRAHVDGEEYGCSIRDAEIGYARYIFRGGRALPRRDVEGL